MVMLQQHVHFLPAEYGEVEHTLALAVLYYVSPDTGFTLDILQWAPRSTALCVKLRLQLHELADMHTFLLGCIVLDMCTIPTYQSGDCALDALGGGDTISHEHPLVQLPCNLKTILCVMTIQYTEMWFPWTCHKSRPLWNPWPARKNQCTTG